MWARNRRKSGSTITWKSEAQVSDDQRIWLRTVSVLYILYTIVQLILQKDSATLIQRKDASKVFVNTAIYIRRSQRLFYCSPCMCTRSQLTDAATPPYTWHSVCRAKSLTYRARWRFFQGAYGKIEGRVIHQLISWRVRHINMTSFLVLKSPVSLPLSIDEAVHETSFRICNSTHNQYRASRIWCTLTQSRAAASSKRSWASPRAS